MVKHNPMNDDKERLMNAFLQIKDLNALVKMLRQDKVVLARAIDRIADSKIDPSDQWWWQIWAREAREKTRV